MIAWGRTGAGLTRGMAAAALLFAVSPHALSAATIVAAKRAPAKKLVETESYSERLHPASLTSFAPPVLDANTFSFTAPGRSAATARLQTVERAFQFTPSGQTGNRKALTLGVTSRVMAAALDTSRAAPPADTLAVAPAGYGVDLSVGWKGFAVSGGYSRADGGSAAGLLPNKREAVDLGLSYRFKSWKTSLQVAAESGGTFLLTQPDRRYSAELGAAYSVTPQLSLSGGVRYAIVPTALGVYDPSRGDSSVYLGTALSF